VDYINVYPELIGLADSLDDHITPEEIASKLRELADRISPEPEQVLINVDLAVMAQRFYGLVSATPGLSLSMNMTDKQKLIDCLSQALVESVVK
jgi:hypothetical protein